MMCVCHMCGADLALEHVQIFGCEVHRGHYCLHCFPRHCRWSNCEVWNRRKLEEIAAQSVA